MFKIFISFITKIFKSDAAKDILKVGIDAYVAKNDNDLTNDTAEVIKSILDDETTTED